jgi:hypothetical protein
MAPPFTAAAAPAVAPTIQMEASVVVGARPPTVSRAPAVVVEEIDRLIPGTVVRVRLLSHILKDNDLNIHNATEIQAD